MCIIYSRMYYFPLHSPPFAFDPHWKFLHPWSCCDFQNWKLGWVGKWGCCLKCELVTHQLSSAVLPMSSVFPGSKQSRSSLMPTINYCNGDLPSPKQEEKPVSAVGQAQPGYHVLTLPDQLPQLPNFKDQPPKPCKYHFPPMLTKTRPSILTTNT